MRIPQGADQRNGSIKPFAKQGMPSVWNLYHLRGNPFFQDPLGSDIVATLPPTDELFVGRADELALAERSITHDSRTRTVITGGAGVGKTTFLNRLRDLLERSGPGDRARTPRLVTHTPALRIQGNWSALDFCAEVLRTILVMRAARQPRAVPSSFLRGLSGIAATLGQLTTVPSFWERVTQVVEGRQLVGLGVQGGTPVAQAGATLQPAWAPPIVPPATLLLLTMDAIRVAAEELDGELVFFLNNLENLSREDAQRAAGVFQDVRDLFLTERSHWVVCGTSEVDALIIRASIQVGGVFGRALDLVPLAPSEVADLLQRRYRALARGVRAVVPPVEPEVGSRLYTLYRGNLRNFLQLLQDAVLRGAGPHGATPIPLERILLLMGREHVRELEQKLGPTAWGYFRQTVLGNGSQDPIWARFRQTDAARRTSKKPPVIKPHMDAWITAGYLLPDAGADPAGTPQARGDWMRLSGVAATAFAALALEQGRPIQPLLEGFGPTA